MKLLKFLACLSAKNGGNVKRKTVMEEVATDGFLDRGSIPLSSTI